METIALIEWLDAEGQVRLVHRVHQWPVRVGRALDNDLVVDDPHVAAHHFTLQADEAAIEVANVPGQTPHPVPLSLMVGSTINGVTRVSGDLRRHAQAGETLAVTGGQVLQCGGVNLRLRLPGEVLAPEVMLPPMRLHQPWLMPLLALLWLALLVVTQWIETQPGTAWLDAFIPVLAAPLVLVLWAAFWALLSKLFRGHFAFALHLRMALPWVLGLSLLEPLLHHAAFALSWPALSRVSTWLEVAGLCTLVWQHLATVLPKRRMHMAWACALGFSLVSLYTGYSHQKKQQRWFSQLYSSTISLPAMRLVPAVPVEAYVQTLQSLEGELSATAAKKDDEGSADTDDEL
jgi:hypothetical protein